MTCQALRAAALDTRITARQFRILAIIEGGMHKRADIAKAAQCSVPTVARAIAKLVETGWLTRIIQEGRVSVLAVVETRITSAETRITHDTGKAKTRITSDTPTRIKGGARIIHDPTTRITDDTPLVDKSLPHIKNAGARAEPLTNITTTLELYPERPESSGEVAARAKTNLVDRVCNAVNSPWLDPNKSAGLITTSPLLGRWAQSLDIDTELVPLLKAKIACNGHDAISSWKYFRGAVEDMIALKTQPESPRNDRQPASTSDADVRRGRISPLTAARRERKRQRDAEREPLDYGRVESQRIE